MRTLVSVFAGVLLSSPVIVLAQSDYTPGSYSPGDGLTQTAIAPGTPAGSYALTGLDNVNYYSGHLNVTIPLYHVGGRGKAGYDIVLPIDQRWSIRNMSYEVSGTTYARYAPLGDVLGEAAVPLYMPGWMSVREMVDWDVAGYNCSGRSPVLGQSLRRLTFTESNGTEHDFVDAQTGGQPHVNTANNCGTDPASADRGTVFNSTDATSMTFIADSSVSDVIFADFLPSGQTGPPPGPGAVSGWLYFRDGTRYRIDSSVVSQIEDSNGNRVTISQPVLSNGQYTTTVTDPANREITVSRADLVSSFQDVVEYPGSGTRRRINVNYALLGSCLRSDYEAQGGGTAPGRLVSRRHGFLEHALQSVRCLLGFAARRIRL